MKHGNESFKVKEERFRYYDHPLKQGELPCPNSYREKSEFDMRNKKHIYSIGVSRDRMDPLFVDNVHKVSAKNHATPAPTQYKIKDTFDKGGVSYTMRAKMLRYGERDENFSAHYLSKQKKLPGPGYYAHPDTIGRNNNSTRFSN
jgi:hypothetical protein